MEKLQIEPCTVYIISKRDFVAKSNGRKYFMVKFQTLGAIFDVFVDENTFSKINIEKDYLFFADLISSNDKLFFSNSVFKEV